MTVEQIEDLRQDWYAASPKRKHFVGREKYGEIFGALAKTEDGEYILHRFNDVNEPFTSINVQEADFNWYFWPFDIRVERPGQTRDEVFRS